MEERNQRILDEFGRLLISEVRDETLSNIHRVLSGEMADEFSKQVFSEFKRLRSQDCEIVRQLLVMAVDAAIVRFLYFLDEYQVETRICSQDGQSYDVRALSDGLHGEMGTENGWIERFSKLKYSLAEP